MEKICVLLRGQESVMLDETLQTLTRKRKKQCEKKKMKQAQSKGRKRPPKLEGKNEYFYFVEASNCIKAYNKWKTILGLVRTIADAKKEKTQWGK